MTLKYPEAPALGGPLLLNANVNEGSDAAGSTRTRYEIDMNDTFSGTITSESDADWIEITLEAGTNYTFNVWGTNGADDGLRDTVLRLRDSAGREVAENDDLRWPENTFSGIQYNPNQTGTYYIDVQGYDTATGDYIVQASDNIWSPTQVARWLTEVSWGVPTEIRFDVTASRGTIDVDLTELSQGRYLARTALEAWSDYTGLNFREVSSGADIVFTENEPGVSAFAGPSSFNPNTGIISGASVTVTDGWIAQFGDDLDDYSFQTYIHEIGHALGLGHPGPYDGNARYGFDNFYVNDSVQMSIMSYFDTDNPNVDISDVTIVTPMIADIRAMELLYGSHDAHTGNTVWGSGSNVGGYLEDIFDEYFDGASRANYDGGGIGFTVKDDGGTDLLDFSNTQFDQVVDLRQGRASDINGETGNMVIALGSVIEDASSGSGNDKMYGNGSNNILRSGFGSDTVAGGSGNDRIYAEGRNSSLYGNNGDDFLRNDAGNTYFSGGSGDDTVAYFRRDSAVSVNLGSGANNTGSTYNSIEGVIGTADHNDTLTGSGNDNELFGGGGNDRLDGGRGDDSLSGGAGNDRLTDSSGADTFNGGTGEDTLSYQDRSSGVEVNLASGRNNSGDTYNSIEHVIGSNNGQDELRGDNDDNHLRGIGGNDRIFGGTGDDTLEGGAGNDYLRDDSGRDDFIGGTGQDTVAYYGRSDGVRADLDTGRNNSGDSYSSIEHLIGSNQGDDTLIGNDGDNRLRGFGGDDTIVGRGGDDTLDGGAGDDYLVDHSGADIFIGGAGDDTVSYEYRERGVTVNLANGDNNSGDTYSSIASVYGSDEGDDHLTGHNGENHIRCFDGDDYIYGKDGDDSIEGGNGNDTLRGGDDADVFVFRNSHDNDTITDFEDRIDKIIFRINGLDFGDLEIESVNAGTLITYQPNDTILLEGIREAQITSADFEFL